MTPGPPIRVLVVDDHTLFRKGVVSLLAGEPGFEVVGEAVDGLDACQQAEACRPDLVLLDLSMPRCDGLEATRRLRAACPSLTIVILTALEDDENLFEAVRCGAQGYLLKRIEPEALFANLRGVMRGEASISRVMAAKIMGEFTRRTTQPPAPPPVALTPRETRILTLVAQGKSNKEIAAELALAENTVKNHMKNILEKLHVENRIQAATYAIRGGLAKPPSGDVGSKVT